MAADLTLVGTGGADTFNISVNGLGNFLLNGADTGVAAGSTKTIEITGQGGNDTINLSSLTANDYASSKLNWDTGDGRDEFTGGDGVDSIVSSASTFAGLKTSFDADTQGIEEIKKNNLQTLTIVGNDSTSTPDVWDFSSATLNNGNGKVVIQGLKGNDTITGSADAETIQGGNGNDTIHGGDGNDKLEGGSGNDTLNGDAGDDELVGNSGMDSLDGGEGSDTYTWNSGDQRDEFADTGTTGTDTIVSTVGSFAGLKTSFDAATHGIEEIKKNNLQTLTIVGNDSTSTPDVWDFSTATLNNGNGKVVIQGLKGNDVITGSVDNETIQGGNGNDTIHGSEGSDKLEGGAGDDVLNGDAGDDELVGNSGMDSLDGGEGSDTYTWNSGDQRDEFADTGTIGTDTIVSTVGSFAGLKTSFDAATQGIEEIKKNNLQTLTIVGNDSTSTPDVWDFSSATLNNGNGKVVIQGLKGNDTITGSTDAETIQGGNGNDTIHGSEGSDKLEGGAGDDVLNGNAGDDELVGNSGMDSLDGGEGSDTYTWNNGDQRDEFADTGTTGTDTIVSTVGSFAGLKTSFDAATQGIEEIKKNNLQTLTIVGNDSTSTPDVWDFSSATLNNGNGKVVIQGLKGNDTITGSTDAETIQGGNGNDTIHGSEGSDKLEGGAGDDVLNGNAGDDELVGNSGMDSLDGGEGSDTYTWNSGDQRDEFADTGTTGTDTIVSTVGSFAGLKSSFDAATQGIEEIKKNNLQTLTIVGNDSTSTPDVWDFSSATLNNGNGKVVIQGLKGNDVITGSVDNETIQGGNGNDTIRGEGGEDRLEGDSGNDDLNGGAGSDVLIGGDGSDTLNGGSNDDTFIWSTGHGRDTYADTSGTDTISSSVKTFAGLPQTFSRAGSGVDIIQKNNFQALAIVGQDSTGSPENWDFAGITLRKATVQLGKGNDSLATSTRHVGGTASYDGESNNDSIDLVFTPAQLGDLSAGTITAIQNYLPNPTGLTLNVPAYSDPANGFGFIARNFEDASVGVYVDGVTTDITSCFAALSGPTGVILGTNSGETITGTSGTEIIFAFGGNDTINAGAGLDCVFAGANNDTIEVREAHAEFDIMIGGAGSDTILNTNGNKDVKLNGFESPSNQIEKWNGAGRDIYGNGGDNTLDFGGTKLIDVPEIRGGSGDDTIGASNSTVGGRYLGENGDDTLIGGSKADTLLGGANNDTITGGSGNDTINGGSGTDTIDGGANNDTIEVRESEAEFDVMFGGAGSDTVLNTNGNKDVKLNGFESPSNQIEKWNGAGRDIYGNGGDNTLDFAGTTLIDVPEIRGGNGNDTIGASNSTHCVRYLGENGNDILIGGSKADKLFGGANSDTITGGSGDDLINGGSDMDTIDGGSNNDTIEVREAEAEFDIMVGGPGSDTVLNTNSNKDVKLDGFDSPANEIEKWDGSGRDIFGNGNANTLNFAGTKLISVPEIRGGNGNDVITGSNSTSGVLYRGENGDDTLNGGSKADTLVGGANNDTINGGAGNDTINGGAGNDTIDGGANNDTIEVREAEAEFDSMEGGPGSDTVKNTNSNKDVKLDAFDSTTNEIEKWNGNGRDIYGNGNANVLNFANTELISVPEIRGGNGNDVITGSNSTSGVLYRGENGDDTLNGGSKADILVGGANNDTINGNAGNDTINGGDGNDTIDGGANNDTIEVREAEAEFDSMEGGPGSDTVKNTNSNKDVKLDAFDSTTNGIEKWNGNGRDIYGNGNANVLNFANTELISVPEIRGGNGNDVITSSNSTSGVTYLGEHGDDTLNGGSKADSLHGGTGNDTLMGGAGNDVLIGADGVDQIFGEGNNDSLYGNLIGNPSDGDDDLLDGGPGNDGGSFDAVDQAITSIEFLL